MNYKPSTLFGLFLLCMHGTAVASLLPREEARMWVNNRNPAAVPTYESLLLPEEPDIEQSESHDDWLPRLEEYIRTGGALVLTLSEDETSSSFSLLDYLQLARDQYHYPTRNPLDYLKSPQTILRKHSTTQMERLVSQHEAWRQSDFIFPDPVLFVRTPRSNLRVSVPMSLKVYNRMHRLHLCAEVASAVLNSILVIAYFSGREIIFLPRGKASLQITAICTRYLACKWSKFSHSSDSFLRYQKQKKPWRYLNFLMQRILCGRQFLTLRTPYDTFFYTVCQSTIFALPLPIEFLSFSRILFLAYHGFEAGSFKWDINQNVVFLGYQLVYLLVQLCNKNKIYKKDHIFQTFRKPYQPRFAEYQKAIELVKSVPKERYDTLQVLRNHHLVDMLGADIMGLIIDYIYSQEDQAYYQKEVDHEKDQAIQKPLYTSLSKRSIGCVLSTSMLVIALLIPWLA